MKKNKGFTLVELISAMAIMVVLLNSFIFITASGVTIIKQDKVKVKTVSFTEYFMQTMKSYGKGYFSDDLGFSPSSTSDYKGYFYFDSKEDFGVKSNIDYKPGLSTIIGSDFFLNHITGKESGDIFKDDTVYDASHPFIHDCILPVLSSNAAVNNRRYGAYFEITASNYMGKNNTGSNIILPSDYDCIKIYVDIVDLKSKDKHDSDLTFYIGR